MKTFCRSRTKSRFHVESCNGVGRDRRRSIEATETFDFVGSFRYPTGSGDSTLFINIYIRISFCKTVLNTYSRHCRILIFNENTNFERKRFLAPVPRVIVVRLLLVVYAPVKAPLRFPFIRRN